MNKTRSVNRLFLFLIIWIFAASPLPVLLLPEMDIWENMVVSELFLLLPALIFQILRREPVKEWIPVKSPRISTLLMTALFTLLLMPLITFLNAFSMLFAENYVASESTALMEASVWKNLFAVAVVPAICEELIFRGVFYHGYKENGILTGALACGLVFGLMHRNINQFFYASVLGVIFCLLLEATGSILCAMFSHFLINAWDVVILALEEKLLHFSGAMDGSVYESIETMAVTREDIVNTVCAYGLLAIVTTAIAACVLVWIAKHSHRLEVLEEAFYGHCRPKRYPWKNDRSAGAAYGTASENAPGNSAASESAPGNSAASESAPGSSAASGYEPGNGSSGSGAFTWRGGSVQPTVQPRGWRRILTPSFTGAVGVCIGYMILQEIL